MLVGQSGGYTVKRLLIPLVFLAFLSNLTVLVSPIFMMQVFDRVIPSGNLYTLALLLLVALGAIAIQKKVDQARDLTFERLALWVEGTFLTPALRAEPERRQQQVNDITEVARALRNTTASTALNIPWLPLFFVALTFVHWAFVVLVVMVLVAYWVVRTGFGAAMRLGEDRLRSAHSKEEASLSLTQNAMSMTQMLILEDNLVARHQGLQMARIAEATGVASLRQSQKTTIGFLRSATQLLALSLGAALVTLESLTPGGMIAASVIVAKLTGAADSALTSVQDIRCAIRAAGSISRSAGTVATDRTDVEGFSGRLTCQTLIVPRGGGAPPRLDKVSLQLEAGETLAILGASGSGKTTLLSMLAGEPAPIGAVFYDDSEVKGLSHNALARSVGVLPQQAVLYDGTLAQNICSFAPDPDPARIVEVARLAGVHGLISSLPDAYELDLRRASVLLSAGQKQRVALARAIFHQPRYLFLDEPNALLDAEGERQLCDALNRLKQAGTTIVMVLHRSGLIGMADKVMVLDAGKVADFGERSEVLARFAGGKRRIVLPLNQNSLQDLSDWVGAQFTRAGDDALRQKTVLVATEMFSIACANVGDDATARATFNFRFLDDESCELSVSKEDMSDVMTKLPKIQSLIRHPHVPMTDLDPEEMSLAMVAQVADRFDVQHVEGHGVIIAGLSNTERMLPGSLGQEVQH